MYIPVKNKLKDYLITEKSSAMISQCAAKYA